MQIRRFLLHSSSCLYLHIFDNLIQKISLRNFGICSRFEDLFRVFDQIFCYFIFSEIICWGNGKKHLRSYSHPFYPQLVIYDDLTTLSSWMLYTLQNRTNSAGTKEYKYILSKEGRIFCRTEQQTRPTGQGQKLPKPGIVNKPSDLLKLGFTDQEE